MSLVIDDSHLQVGLVKDKEHIKLSVSPCNLSRVSYSTGHISTGLLIITSPSILISRRQDPWQYDSSRNFVGRV